MSKYYDSSMHEEIISSVMKESVDLREQQIIGALEDRGHKFNNKKELFEFARTRCAMVRSVNSTIKILHVDGVPVCSWDDSVTIENTLGTFKIIVGK